MRARLRAGVSSSRYRPGQFVSASYAARYPDRVQLVVEPEADRALIQELGVRVRGRGARRRFVTEEYDPGTEFEFTVSTEGGTP